MPMLLIPLAFVLALIYVAYTNAVAGGLLVSNFATKPFSFGLGMVVWKAPGVAGMHGFTVSPDIQTWPELSAARSVGKELENAWHAAELSKVWANMVLNNSLEPSTLSLSR